MPGLPSLPMPECSRSTATATIKTSVSIQHKNLSAFTHGYTKGGDGAVELANEVVRLCEEEDSSGFRFSYEDDCSIDDKLTAITQKIYRGNNVNYTAEALKQKKQLEEMGFDKLPVCVAKTQYSFSDDAKKIGAPEGFDITVRNLKVSAGAGFVVALTGSIMTMPGLPKVPAAEKIDIDENGNISGLF